MCDKGGSSEHASDNSVRWPIVDSLTALGHWTRVHKDTLVLGQNCFQDTRPRGDKLKGFSKKLTKVV